MKDKMINHDQADILRPESFVPPVEQVQHHGRLRLYILSATHGYLPGEIVLFPYDQAMDLINKNIARRA